MHSRTCWRVHRAKLLFEPWFGLFAVMVGRCFVVYLMPIRNNKDFRSCSETPVILIRLQFNCSVAIRSCPIRNSLPYCGQTPRGGDISPSSDCDSRNHRWSQRPTNTRFVRENDLRRELRLENLTLVVWRISYGWSLNCVFRN